MKDTCVFTIVAKNYISHARVLMKSLLNYHADVDRFVLVADKIDGYFDPSKEVFKILEADELTNIKDFPSFSFKYNIIEFSTAVKPYFIEYLFLKYRFKKVIYFDPDIVIFNTLTEIFDLLDTYSIVLSPHIMKPIPDDGYLPSEIHVLKSGCFNLGFMGLSRSKTTEALLSWWKDRLYDKCLIGPISGYMVDQIWINLVPCFFSDYFVLKKPGYNVSYWNLHERPITKRNGKFMVGNCPLYFSHFSGFDINSPDRISRFQNRYKSSDTPGLKELLEIYGDLLVRNGYNESSKWPYHYQFYRNGSKIADLTKAMYWGLATNSNRFGNPFDGFYRRLLRGHNFDAVFKKRFLFALIDKIAIHILKFLRPRSNRD